MNMVNIAKKLDNSIKYTEYIVENLNTAEQKEN